MIQNSFNYSITVVIMFKIKITCNNKKMKKKIDEVK